MQAVPAHKIYWSHRFLLIYGEHLDTAPHRHHAVQIAIGMENPVEVSLGQDVRNGVAIVVDADTKHQLTSKGRSLMVLIDPESLEAEAIRRQMGEPHHVAVEDARIQALRRTIEAGWNEDMSIENAYDLYVQIIRVFTDDQVVCKHIDPRIADTLQHIKRHPQDTFTPGDLAQKVHLSESRFQHLFKDNVGIPMQKYILWQRALCAVQAIVNGESITRAAHEAGFADGAHFSRTIKCLFGASMQSVFKHSRSVQVITDKTL